MRIEEEAYIWERTAQKEIEPQPEESKDAI
jgi:hypothetical protein